MRPITTIQCPDAEFSRLLASSLDACQRYAKWLQLAQLEHLYGHTQRLSLKITALPDVTACGVVKCADCSGKFGLPPVIITTTITTTIITIATTSTTTNAAAATLAATRAATQATLSPTIHFGPRYNSVTSNNYFTSTLHYSTRSSIILTHNKVVYKLNITITPIYAVKSLLTLAFLNPLEIGNSRVLGWDTSCFLCF